MKSQFSKNQVIYELHFRIASYTLDRVDRVLACVIRRTVESSGPKRTTFFDRGYGEVFGKSTRTDSPDLVADHETALERLRERVAKRNAERADIQYVAGDVVFTDSDDQWCAFSKMWRYRGKNRLDVPTVEDSPAEETTLGDLLPDAPSDPNPRTEEPVSVSVPETTLGDLLPDAPSDPNPRTEGRDVGDAFRERCDREVEGLDDEDRPCRYCGGTGFEGEREDADDADDRQPLTGKRPTVVGLSNAGVAFVLSSLSGIPVGELRFEELFSGPALSTERRVFRVGTASFWLNGLFRITQKKIDSFDFPEEV